MNNRDPIVIGGVGGSGTRVVARIAMDLGLYLGDQLNESDDNLLVALLLKRPYWHTYASHTHPDEIVQTLRLIRKTMTTNDELLPHEIKRLSLAAKQYEEDPSEVQRLLSAIVHPRSADFTRYTGWGWKEPNSHIYLPYLHRCFPAFKYIHVIRNGLSMAYSGNQQQLANWGHLFGIRLSDEPSQLPKQSLQYWIRANERIIRFQRQVMGERMLFVHFERLCTDPEAEVPKIAEFIGTGQFDLSALVKRIVPPNQLDKYRNEDLSVFDEAELEAVRQLGFDVVI